MASISIIIPAFNVENYIDVTLNSLLNQTNQEFEIIVVNDGSTDNTLKVVEEIMAKSSFKNYKIVDQQNRGVSAARNRGILESRGEYVYFLDGDDYVSNKLVSTIKKRINHENPDIIAWGYDNVKEDKTVMTHYFDQYNSKKIKMTGIEALKDILKENKRLWICACSAIYKKELIIKNNIYYEDGCSNGEDQEFTFKALSKAKSVHFINEILFFYVQRGNSTSNSYNIKKFEVVNVIDRVANYIDQNESNEKYDIVQYLKTNHLFGNFLHVFNGCIRCLQYEKKMNSIVLTKRLVHDIDKEFPNLCSDIKTKIRRTNFSTTNTKFATRIKYILFSISPIIYVSIYRFGFKIKNKGIAEIN